MSDDTVEDPSADDTFSAAMPSDSKVAPGTRVGRYIVSNELGRGGMGTVVRAVDPDLEREIAVKLLRRFSTPAKIEEYRRRFAREGRALAALAHPNVVAVFDVGLHEGALYIAMELVDGISLDRWLKAEPRSWEEIVHVFASAGRGLDAAHRSGLVHRDFKPQNVLVDATGQAKVVDFGLARNFGDATPTPGSASASDASLQDDLTQGGHIVGTPHYMAPEQFERGPLGPAADQFGFCVAMYEALYEQRPFLAASFRALVHEVRHGSPEPIPRGTKVPARIGRALLKGLRRRPEERHASMDALLGHLAPRRIGVVPISAGVGLVAVTMAVVLIPAGSTRAPCSADVALADTWSEARQSAIATRFSETSPTYGEQAWSRVKRAMGDRVDAWRQDYDATCEIAALDRGAADRRFACLNRLRSEYDALLARLDSGETHVVYAAVAATLDLGRSSDCDAPQSEGAELGAVRERIAKARAQLALGDPDEAAKLARELWENPERVDTKAAQALILSTWGRAEAARGAEAEAERRLKDAHALALEAADDTTATRTAASLLSLAASDGRLDEADDWARHAEATLVRLAEPGETRVDVLDRRARLDRAHGDFDGAIRRRRSAVAAAKELQPDGGPNLATVMANLATDLRAAGKLTEAIATHEAALKMRQESLGAEHPEVGLSLLGIAVCRSQLGEFAAAETALREVVRLYEGAYGTESPMLIAPLGNLANTVSARDHHEAALVLYDRTLNLAVEAHGPDSPQVVPWLGNSAVALRHLGRYDEAVARQLRALELEVATFGDRHPGIATSRLMLGETHEAAGKLVAAARAYDQALDLLREHSIPALLGQALFRRARVHAAMDEPARALPLAAEAVGILEKTPADPEELAKAKALLEALP